MADNKLDIKAFLDKDEQKDLLRLLTAGSVDDGKSTLIGRLLFDSKKLYEDQLDALERDSKRVGNAGEHIDYALLLDGLKAEREQGITIDVAYRYFSTNGRKFIIADTPGHEQYTRNMITGGSTANLAIILVDARTGVITQTRRHTFLVSLLGIKHVVLAVNKMDLVDFSEERFNEIVAEYKKFVSPLGIPDVNCIPLSALDGDNVVDKSERTPWYKGTSLLDFLETVHIDNDHNLEDFRFPVQYVLRPNLDFRGFCGKVASGIVRKGDTVMALPSGKTSKVKSIVTYDGELDYAFPPQSVTLTLEDEIDVSRGEMLVHPDNLPIVDRNFEAMMVWMDEEPMDINKSFFIKQTTNLSRTRIDAIKYKVDVNTMEHLSIDNGQLTKDNLPLQLNQIARVVLTTAKELFFDPYKKNKSCGSFILIDPITNNTSAVGMIIDRVEMKDMAATDDIPVLDLSKLDIAPEHHAAIEKVVKELERQGETNTRITLEDFIAGLTAEYYNYVQQEIRLKNFLYAVSLSKERLRIVEERYHIGNFSRLDYQQAKVDFNADSAQYMKQQELVVTSRINLNELMAVQEVNRPLRVNDSIITVNDALNYDELWESTLKTNANLLKADQNTTIAQLDYRQVLSRNYPYVKLNAGYGYTFNKYETNATSRRSNWGLNGGITVGINLWDGNRRREKRNASLQIRNSQLEREQLELGLKADLSNLWQAYRNNLRLLNLERQNLVAARENHEIAKERYLLGDLSGIEMREAQKSLLDAEERILSAEYNTKVCEISLLQLSGRITKYLE